MDTKILEYVIAIAEEKSLSKAAERLYLSQPALSQRLKKLEDELWFCSGGCVPGAEAWEQYRC